jgi:hypothetical protein
MFLRCLARQQGMEAIVAGAYGPGDSPPPTGDGRHLETEPMGDPEARRLPAPVDVGAMP